MWCPITLKHGTVSRHYAVLLIIYLSKYFFHRCLSPSFYLGFIYTCTTLPSVNSHSSRSFFFPTPHVNFLQTIYSMSSLHHFHPETWIISFSLPPAMPRSFILFHSPERSNRMISGWAVIRSFAMQPEASLTSHHLLQPSISISTNRVASHSPPQCFPAPHSSTDTQLVYKTAHVLRSTKKVVQRTVKAQIYETCLIRWKIIQKESNTKRLKCTQHSSSGLPAPLNQTPTLELGWSPSPLSQCQSLYLLQSLSLEKPRSNLSLQSPSNSSLKSISKSQRPLSPESLRPISSTRALNH